MAAITEVVLRLAGFRRGGTGDASCRLMRPPAHVPDHARRRDRGRKPKSRGRDESGIRPFRVIQTYALNFDRREVLRIYRGCGRALRRKTGFCAAPEFFFGSGCNRHGFSAGGSFNDINALPSHYHRAAIALGSFFCKR